jgi:hypothetical protein
MMLGVTKIPIPIGRLDLEGNWIVPSIRFLCDYYQTDASLYNLRPYPMSGFRVWLDTDRCVILAITGEGALALQCHTRAQFYHELFNMEVNTNGKAI